MSELSEITNRLQGHEIRLAAVEQQQTRMSVTVENQLASREWVREIITPVTEATREIKHAVEVMGRDMSSLNAAHNKLLEERAKRETEEHEAKMRQMESQTWSNVIKDKWAPILAFALSLAAALSLLLQYLGK